MSWQWRAAVLRRSGRCHGCAVLQEAHGSSRPSRQPSTHPEALLHPCQLSYSCQAAVASPFEALLHPCQLSHPG